MLALTLCFVAQQWILGASQFCLFDRCVVKSRVYDVAIRMLSRENSQPPFLYGGWEAQRHFFSRRGFKIVDRLASLSSHQKAPDDWDL
jgi:hypothetical protein